MTSAHILSDAVFTASATDTSTVVLDLSRVTFFGSAGLSVLIQASDADIPLRIVPSSQARRPIEVTGLDRALDIYPTLAEALAEFTVPSISDGPCTPMP